MIANVCVYEFGTRYMFRYHIFAKQHIKQKNEHLLANNRGHTSGGVAHDHALTLAPVWQRNN